MMLTPVLGAVKWPDVPRRRARAYKIDGGHSSIRLGPYPSQWPRPDPACGARAVSPCFFLDISDLRVMPPRSEVVSPKNHGASRGALPLIRGNVPHRAARTTFDDAGPRRWGTLPRLPCTLPRRF